ncbi:MAG: KamA family radical SAM protein [Planctomycetes bacterium]|nr:KamA family radical SAM protein [Planctomycetota bacterium]
MEAWQRLMGSGVNRLSQLTSAVPEADPKTLKPVEEQFPVRINRYYLELIQNAPDEATRAQLLRQVMPDTEELLDIEHEEEDPLSEERQSPVPGLTHRYPNRVLFYVSHQCPIYCRYCTRKRKVGDPASVSRTQLEGGLRYITAHPEVKDVILSGGDPLMLHDEALVEIVSRLRAIPHVEIIRLGTRIPSALPQRITEKLCKALQPYHPIYVMAHFDHPDELTPEAKGAADLLANHGFPMMNQTVLLRGVNDEVETLRRLFQGLLRMRIKPYYLYQADLTKGTEYFRTTTRRGIELMQGLRGHISGLAVPYYVIDAPGGGGKIPILPEYVESMNEKEIVLRNYRGIRYVYPEPVHSEEPAHAPQPMAAEASPVRRPARPGCGPEPLAAEGMLGMEV